MKIKFESKFSIGDKVWFMHRYEPTQGIIYEINYKMRECVNNYREYKSFFDKIKNFFIHKRTDFSIIYSIDIIDNNGHLTNEVCFRQECKIFPTKKELLLKSL